MSNLLTKTFWLDAAERAVKTAAQAAVALIGANGLGVTNVDWLGVANVAGLAAVLSVLTSVGSSKVGDSTPSLVSQPSEGRHRAEDGAVNLVVVLLVAILVVVLLILAGVGADVRID